MYFANDKHKQNFHELLKKYPVGITDSLYKAAFYIVAHPVIFNHCDNNPCCDGDGPFDWYFAGPDQSTLYAAGLSSSYQFLVRAGLNLYNNHRHEDNFADFTPYLALGAWGDELFLVFIEACQIRRGRQVVTI